MNNRVVLVVVFFFMTIITMSQDISGIVLDLKTGEPIVDVSIELLPSNKTILTDSKGEFCFNEVDRGDYILIFQHTAYHHESEKINLLNDKDIFITKYLDIKWIELNSVEICSNKQDKRVLKCNSIYNAEIVEKSMHDVGEVLKSVPNINAVRKGGVSLDPVLRGFRYGQLNVQLNSGVKIEGGCPNRMDPTFSHISPYDITEVNIYNGPYSFRFGPSMGGVINVITEKPIPFREPQVHIKALAGYETNGQGEYKSLAVFGGGTKVFFNVFGGSTVFGDYSDGEGREYNTAYQKHDYSSKVGFRFKHNHEVTVSYAIAKGRDVKYAALPMDERSDDTHLFSVDYTIKNISEKIPLITMKYYNSDVKHQMDNIWRSFSDTVVAVSDIHAINSGGRAELQYTNDDVTIFVGGDYEDIYKDGDRVKNMILQPGLPVRTENLWSDASIKNIGLFFTYENKSSYIDWMVSARIDNNKGDSDDVLITNPKGKVIYEYGKDSISSDYLNFSAGAGMSVELSKGLVSKINIGRGVRSADMVERFITLLPIGYDKFDYLGNPSLKPEINNQIELNMTYNNDVLGKISVTGFYSFVQNYITGEILPPTQQRPLSQGVLGVKQFYNADKAFLHGFELRYLTKKYYNCYMDISSAYTSGYIDATEVYDIINGTAVDVREEKNDPIPELAPLEINIKLNYKNDKMGLSGYISYRFATEQNHLSKAYGEDLTPMFSVVDAQVMYRYNKMLSFSGGVKNLFDVAYYEHLNRNIIGSEHNFYERGRSCFINMKINL